MRHDFLLEIGCENIPSGYLGRTLAQLRNRFGSFLKEERIPHESLYVTGTPNRLVVHVRGLAAKQDATEERVIGPPARAALEPGGGYTKAAEGFARSQGVPLGRLTTVNTEKGEYIAVIKRIQGRTAVSLLRETVPRFIEELTFPKTMKWDESGLRFARPIRWILSLCDSRAMRLKIGGLVSGGSTKLSPFFEAAVQVDSIAKYYRLLERNGIILDSVERREKVRRSAREAAKRHGGTLVEDEDLVHIVSDLLESPVALVGRFDSSFLSLPHDVVVTALKSHQRYFSVEGRGGKLMPIFVAFADGARKNKKEIAKGYERVLQARLADAEFYYREDTSHPLSALSERLDRIVWLEKLGTLGEKARRIERLALFIREQTAIGGPELVHRLRLAASLAKADLASEMVKDGKEFTLLQGYIGREYALVSGIEREVAEAIFEHHLPRFAGDVLPATDTGSILAVADKIDTIVGCFMIGLGPTGSQDPYALRRHALGMLRIMIERGMSISIPTLIEESIRLYGAKTPGDLHADAQAVSASTDERNTQVVGEKVLEFLENRLSGMMREKGYDHDLVQAVLSAYWEYPLAPFEMAGELQNMREEEDLQLLVRAMKRIINILPKERKGPMPQASRVSMLDALAKRNADTLGFSPALFGEPAERELFEAASQAGAELVTLLSNKDLKRSLGVIRGVVPAIDTYFDAVLVNCEDERIKSNRLSFLSSLFRAFSVFCDFSIIAGE